MNNKFLLMPVCILTVLSAFLFACGFNGQAPETSADNTETYDADWWKKQPDLAKEEPSIKSTITGLTGALTAKDTKQALTFFAPEEREKYTQILGKSPGLMPQLAKDLENATLIYLSPDTDGTLNRIAEYSIKIDAATSVSIIFIKIDGKWLLKSV